MKCPNCQKQNKPNVKKCVYCNALMPIRKKKSTDSKKNVKKEETVKEPIIELEEEKLALKHFINSVRNVNKIVWVYLLLIVVAVILIILINQKRSTITCKLINSDSDYSYSINILMKHVEDNVTYFEYGSKYTSDSSSKKDYKDTYEAMIEGLSSKSNFSNIVSGSYGRGYWELNYKFNESDFEYSNDYIDFDLTKYSASYSKLVEELKTVGFECK